MNGRKFDVDKLDRPPWKALNFGGNIHELSVGGIPQIVAERAVGVMWGFAAKSGDKYWRGD